VGRKTNGTGGAPTPPWLWLLLILGFGLIFWQFAPKNEVAVDYSPWFLDQVNADNVKSLSIQGNEGRGELRKMVKYKQPGTSLEVPVTKFVTHFTTEASIDRVEAILQAKNKDKPIEQQTRIIPEPPQGATGLVWVTLLLPTFVIVGLIYFMMRRARDQFDGGILGSFVKSPAKRHDKSKQRTTFDEVAGLENAKGELQEIVEFLKSPEKFQRLGGRIPKGVLLIGPPARARPCWPRAVAGEAGVPSSRSRAPSSSRCSSASAPAGSATCSRRPRRTAPASCSSTRSTPSAASGAPASGAGTTSASRRSTRSSPRWTASPPTRA
jgi:cell division protease FtsH